MLASAEQWWKGPDSDADSFTFNIQDYAQSVNKWPLVAYLLTACFCLGCSTTCHLCFVKSGVISHLVGCLDYWGIAILFLGSIYPLVSFKFACGPFIIWRYLFTMLTIIMTIVCMVVTLKPMMLKPKNRVILFTTFALTFVFPLLFL
jgi:predicted membrane channel-forming protein YqfA (hemolysin III family)